MPSRLREFRDRNQLTDDGLAALLTDRLGEPITIQRVRNQLERYSDRRLPKKWQDALGIEPLPEPEEASASAATAGFRSGDDAATPDPAAQAPKAPAAVPDELDWRSAKEAIESIYKTIGMGVAQIRKRPQIAEVFKQGAPVLADDWIRLARVDARVRALIAKLMVVGPGGQLAMDHLILVGKLISLEKPDAATSLPRPEQFVAFDGPPPPPAAGNGDGAGRPVDEPRTASTG